MDRFQYCDWCTSSHDAFVLSLLLSSLHSSKLSTVPHSLSSFCLFLSFRPVNSVPFPLPISQSCQQFTPPIPLSFSSFSSSYLSGLSAVFLSLFLSLRAVNSSLLPFPTASGVFPLPIFQACQQCSFPSSHPQTCQQFSHPIPIALAVFPLSIFQACQQCSFPSSHPTELSTIFPFPFLRPVN